MMKNENEWLENLKPGDRVIVRGQQVPDFVRAVKRLTKTIIILNTGHRYRKNGGFQVASGYSFYTTHLCTGSAEEMAKLLIDEKNRNLLTDVKAINFDQLNGTKLKQILDIVKI